MRVLTRLAFSLSPDFFDKIFYLILVQTDLLLDLGALSVTLDFSAFGFQSRFCFVIS